MPSDRMIKIQQYLLPKRLITCFAGLLASMNIPWLKNKVIASFIRHFHVDMSEAVHALPEDYRTFNDFFIRHLKPGVRPIASADLICPVDGYVSELGNIHAGRLLQAKGRYYHVNELLSAPKDVCDRFCEGSFITLYLSPKDYHRIHMPIEGTLVSMTHVPGTLFSVQPATTRTIPRLFARNERLIVWFDTAMGRMAMVLVGATIVGAIGTSWHGDVQRRLKKTTIDYASQTPSTMLHQAEEMGYFKLGSTVIVLFESGHPLRWDTSMKSGQAVKMGQAMAALL